MAPVKFNLQTEALLLENVTLEQVHVCIEYCDIYGLHMVAMRMTACIQCTEICEVGSKQVYAVIHHSGCYWMVKQQLL